MLKFLKRIKHNKQKKNKKDKQAKAKSSNDNKDDKAVGMSPKVGTKKFERMVFELNHPINVVPNFLKYNGEIPRAIRPGLFLMPCYNGNGWCVYFHIADHFGTGSQDVSFVRFDIDFKHHKPANAQVVTTGKGMNIVGRDSPEDGNHVLKFFKRLQKEHRGYWHLVYSVPEDTNNKKQKPSKSKPKSNKTEQKK